MGRVLGKRRDPPGPPLAFHQGQCRSRFLVSERDGQMGVHVGQEPVHHDPGHVPGVSHLGCLCLQGDSSAAKVHDLVPGPSGCGFGCPSSQMGQGHLSLSSSSSVAESVAEGSNTENQSDFDLLSVVEMLVEPLLPLHHYKEAVLKLDQTQVLPFLEPLVAVHISSMFTA